MSMVRKPLKVRFLGKPLIPPFRDSSKNLTRDLVLCMDGENIKPVVFGDRDVFSQTPWVHVDNCKKRGDDYNRYSSSLIDRLRVLVRLVKPDPDLDLLHAVFAPTAQTALVTRVLKKIKRIPCVQTLVSRPGKLTRFLLFGDRIIALSKTRQMELEHLGFHNVVLIRPGIIPPAMPGEGDIARTRNNLKIDDGIMILFPGDLAPFGGWREMLEAHRLVLEKVQSAHLVLACRKKGRGKADSPEHVRQAVINMGIEESVVILDDEVDDMASLISASSIVALPAQSLFAKSDAPLVLLEAMALKKPVLVSRIPELLEIVEDGAGLAANTGDPAALARAMLSVIKSPEQAGMLGESAFVKFNREFSATTMAFRHESLYQELAADRSRS
ncbi:MAG: glycosyltransferase family 4 protein [Deltaproteobacteria bacterium]|nr:glycosyltransferase family 4 protein [Deltaproteobacteria bacterium]